MTKYILILFSILMIDSSYLRAQSEQEEMTFFGTIKDKTDASALVGATILMINVKDSSRSKYGVSDSSGKFIVKGLEQAFYRLKISYIGYKPFTKIIRISMSQTDIGSITLEVDVAALDEVLVSGEIIAVQQIGDTTQFNALAYKTNPDASAKDLVSKMPGIVVDSDGVSADGESVKQVLLDGKRFFGQDPLLSLNTIPADIVDKIQVYDEESDQSRLTGFDDGNTTKTMNVVTKKDRRNGLFGKVYAGYGENNLYKVGSSVNIFNGDQRLSILGMTNNINQQNFGNEDLIGLGSGGGRGGSRRGGNQNFNTGTQDGITTTHSAGINFSDELSEKTTIESSYFFNRSVNTNDQILNRETFLRDGSQFYSEEQGSTSYNINHRLNLRLDHKINDNNSLGLRTALSYQDNESVQQTKGETLNDDNELLSATTNSYQSLNKSLNFSNNLILQHKFEKVGRTISLDLNTRYQPTNRESFFEDALSDSLTNYNTDETALSTGASITYTEPVGLTGQLAASYAFNNTNRKIETNTFVVGEGNESGELINELSNKLSSSYQTHVPSIRYSNNKYGNIFDISLAYQYASLDNTNSLSFNDEVSNPTFHDLLPSIFTRFQLSESGSIMARYSTSTTAPSANQLQRVVDNSDPLFLSLGNPDLKRSYDHQLFFRFEKNFSDQNSRLSNRISFSGTNNYIGNSTSIIANDSVSAGGVVFLEGAQIGQPVNLDSYMAIRNNTTYGILISPIKNNLNISLGLSYVKLPGITNGIRNTSESYSADLKLGLVSNISERVDYNIYYRINGTKALNSLQSESNNQYFTQTLGSTLNLIFPKGFVFRNETSFQKYNGINDSFDTQYTLWNMAIAKKFLKDDRGELELSVFDLLGENQSFAQEVNSRYIQESQTEVLQRYFMLTFTYQIRNFK